MNREEYAMEFSDGDVVQLKSGGPFMTVESIGPRVPGGSDVVWCIWFETVRNQQQVKREAFPPITLEKCDQSAVGGWGLS